MSRATVLTIDDDANLQLVVREYLESDSYEVIQALNGRETEQLLADKIAFDIVLLDLGLPDIKGLALISKIRAQSPVPIIIVSGKSDTTEKIVGLELGADDYMTKPFEMRELSARIKAVLRRHDTHKPAAGNDQHEKGPSKILFDNWVLDRTQYQLFNKDQQSADLTTGEFKLLEALAMSSNRVLSREHLFELTRNNEFEAYDRAIDIQIARLRKKLNDDPKTPTIIKTIRGIGYMFCAETRAA